jgi:hypothetical protein
MIQCWKCSREIDIGPRLLFRAVCIYCSIDLHVCKNCRHFAPGKPNDCNVPNTEFVRDREAANFCEDFAIKKPTVTTDIDPMKKAKQLFGEDLPKKKNPLLDEPS